MTKWYDSDNPSTVVRGATWRGMIWVLLILVFIAVVGIAWWAFGVATAPVKGQGDAYKQKESASNRIVKQAFFEDTYADYESTVAKLKPAKQALKQNPDSVIKQTEYTGLQNYCLDVVASYNAESNKYLAADFKRVDLPYELDRNACTN